MTMSYSTVRVTRSARHVALQSDLCKYFASISIHSRTLSTSIPRYATPTLHPTTTRDRSAEAKSKQTSQSGIAQAAPRPSYADLTPAERAARAAERAREKIEQQQQQQQLGLKNRVGGLAGNSLFAEKASKTEDVDGPVDEVSPLQLADSLSFAVNPRPNARASWQRKMLIRHVRRRGRLPRDVQIARTERDHLSKSHFFKTSMKKLAPLARQIAGKSIDEAILQMRFSKKRAARDVREHLIQARDEAIVVKGMGLDPARVPSPTDSPVTIDPAIAPPLAHQNPTKSIKQGFEKSQTDIYVAQAWVGRGPYGAVPEFRARGRVNTLRPPWTGISVLLKEEKTRTREMAEKEAKAIRKRMGKNMWVQLPDRPITRQSQYVLW